MKQLDNITITKIKKEFLSEFAKVSTLEQIEELRLKYFGRKGIIKSLFKQLSDLPLEKRKFLGEQLNTISKELSSMIEEKRTQLNLQVQQQTDIKLTKLYRSLPGVSFLCGNLHPLQKVLNEIIYVFVSLGYKVEYGPEIESEDYNFTKLNIPEDHPARDMQDTLYLELPSERNNKMLLRTHTSPVQIRVLLANKPPIKIIAPGRVYRHDNVDASHLFNFHQVEGLVVDKGIKLSDLKGTLNYFIKSIFGSETVARFRQSYFPFTEPSLEVDIKCISCKGSGCALCKNSGYLEVLGCGMVHPEVLNNVGYGYEEYTGFAFGLGVERIAMLKYGITDMRLFFSNDLRFLKQF